MESLGRPNRPKIGTKSSLEAFFSQKLDFSKYSPRSSESMKMTPRRRPRRPKIGPRRLQDDLDNHLFSSSFLSSILVRLGSDFGSILAPSWPPFGSQHRPKCRASADPVELKTTLTTHDGPRRPQEAPKTPQEAPKSRPRTSKTPKRHPKTPQDDQKSTQHTPKTTKNRSSHLIIS